MNNRVWVYASLQKFSNEVEKDIRERLSLFLGEWNAHGIALKADFDVLFHHLVIISVDEKQSSASGCSIDKQVQFMKDLGKKHGIDFFNRLLIAFEKNDEFFIYPSSTTRALFDSEVIKEDTQVFDMTVSTEEQYRTAFKVPITKTWLSKYIPKVSEQQ